MQRSDHQTGVARRVPARDGRKATMIVALALVTGLGGALALLHEPAPARAQTGPLGGQTLTAQTFTDLARSVVPAVVAVQVSGKAGRSTDFERMVPRDGPFRDFFERFFENPEDFERFGRRGDDDSDDDSRPARPRLSQGSGFIISPDGYIVTNHHVVDEADEITIVTDDGDRHVAELIGTDERTDLAVLKIDAGAGLPNVAFSDEEAQVGQWVMAVGNPFGLGGTVTTGIVSARGRILGNGPYDDYIQIDAAVNRGNSGGPSFNLDGEVIGVNTAIFSPNGGSVGIGFAIPASLAGEIVDQLIDKGEITRGWLGVSIQTVTPDIAESVGLDEPTGTIVADVFDGGPAAQARLVPGDVVLKVGDVEVESPRDLARMIAEISPGDTVDLVILRDRREKVVGIEIGAMPANPRAASLERDSRPQAKLGRLAELGLEVEPASKAEDDPDARGVVVTRVESDGEAAAKGIARGDRILRVAGVEVNTPEELDQALEGARDDGLASVLALVRSRNGQRFVTLELTRT
jgi:serine protease Do